MYDLDQEKVALERAQSAMAFIEQIEFIIYSLEALKANSPVNLHAEIDAIVSRSRAIYVMVNDSEVEFDIVAERRNLSTQSLSKIERLGIGKEIVRLRLENRVSLKEIAEKFSLSTATVSQFLKVYDQAKPDEQVRMRRTSIFDTSEQYERLGVKLDILYAKVIGSDQQVSVQVLGEMRKTIESAERFMGKYSEREKMERVLLIIQEILQSELPEKRVAIMQRFAALGLKGTPGTSLPA